MTPLEWLGLPEGADERALKRAYAQRLRATRPDDDPGGFQQLHEIYQAALEQCRRAPIAVAPAKARDNLLSMPSTSYASMEAAAPAPFDLAGFPACAIHQATTAEAGTLQSWLETLPALWSLSLKTQAGECLFDQLYREAPPMAAECFDVLLRFFDKDNVLTGHDSLTLQRLQQRMQLAWELQPEHHGTLMRRLDMDARTLKNWLRQLSRPFRWWQVALVGLIPEATGHLGRFVVRLTHGHPEDLLPSFDPRQVHFWPQAIVRGRVNKPRLLIGASRCAAALLFATLVGALLSKVLAPPPAMSSLLVMAWVVGMVAAPCLIWVAWMVWIPFENWHARPEQLPVRWPWLNLLLVPLLCAAGLADWLGTNHSPLAFLPLGGALWLAFRRLLLRGHGLPRAAPRVIWMAIFLVYPITNALHDGITGSQLINHVYIFATIALLLWAWDLWRHRHWLRVRRQAI